MLSQVKSMSLLGLTGYLVTVQVDISNGLPMWDIVGLPDISVKESKQRVRAALKNIGMAFPSRKITINLAPAHLRKEGSYFDLPIAVGILSNFNQISSKLLKDSLFIGELSLDGSLNRVNGALPICLEAKKLGIKRIFLPYENRNEASVVKGLEVCPANSLLEVIEHLNDSHKLTMIPNSSFTNLPSSPFSFDYSEVKGQDNAKRALEIAAAGNHNCLLIGPPGSGKTMLAKRLPSILPDLSFEEMLEITKIHSIAGTLPQENSLITTRPFRAPHHTITQAALVGGGKIPKPGEISLAHLGVLYFDEFLEFKSSILDLMRSPLEDREITLNRVLGAISYPCNFMLVASMNPCPCGFYGSKLRECTCSTEQIAKYQNRCSGPLLDRIDIQVEVSNISYQDLKQKRTAESSTKIKERVNHARLLQKLRYQEDGIITNSQLTPKLISKYCLLDSKSEILFQSAFQKLNLSARAHDRILKLARTIADLDESKNIEMKHLAEAIQYRSLDRKYWR